MKETVVQVFKSSNEDALNNEIGSYIWKQEARNFEVISIDSFPVEDKVCVVVTMTKEGDK